LPATKGGREVNPQHEREAGELLKENILQNLAVRREIYVNRGRRVLLERLLSHGMATADDVRRAVELPAGIDPRCLGSVPGHLSRAGIIRRVGFISSDRKERHASTLSVWELADASAARAWLAAHPDNGPDAGLPVVDPIQSNDDTGPALVMPSLLF